MTTDPTQGEEDGESRRSTATNEVVAADAGRSPGSRTGKPGGAPPNPEPPDALVQRFVKRGQDYLFPDGALAFTDRGERLTTPPRSSR